MYMRALRTDRHLRSLDPSIAADFDGHGGSRRPGDAAVIGLYKLDRGSEIVGPQAVLLKV